MLRINDDNDSLVSAGNVWVAPRVTDQQYTPLVRDTDLHRPTGAHTASTFACVWTLHRKLQHPCIRTCSPATALPCLAQWGSRHTIASLHRCTLCCVEEGEAPSLACVAPHAAASAADDMVYNLASACKRPGRASYLGNSKVDFCRSFIFPRRTAVNTRCGRVAVPEESSA